MVDLTSRYRIGSQEERKYGLQDEEQSPTNYHHHLRRSTCIGHAFVPCLEHGYLHHHPQLDHSPLLNLTKHLQTLARLLLVFPHQPCNVPEFGNARVPHALIDPRLTGRHHRPLCSQTRQSNGHFLLVAGRHAISQDIYFVSLSKKIERCLGHADVRFYSYDHAA